MLLSALADTPTRLTTQATHLCREATTAPLIINRRVCARTSLKPSRRHSTARRLLALLASASAAWVPVLLACALNDTRFTCVVVGMALALGTALVDCIVAWALHRGKLCKVCIAHAWI